MLNAWLAGTEPWPPGLESAMSRRTGETEARVPEAEKHQPRHQPSEEPLPTQGSSTRAPRHRGTCFSPSSQGGLRQVIPPCASVISCPNEVASAQPGPGIWSQASLHPTPPRASLWRSLIAEATTADHTFHHGCGILGPCTSQTFPV